MSGVAVAALAFARALATPVPTSPGPRELRGEPSTDDAAPGGLSPTTCAEIAHAGELVYHGTPGFNAYFGVSAFWSVVCLLYIVAQFLRHRRLRRHPNTIILSKCICDLTFLSYALVHAVAVTFKGELTDGESVETKCDECANGVLAFFTQFCLLASELYLLMLFVDLRLSILSPFSSYERAIKVYHGIVLGTSAVSATLLVGVTTDVVIPGSEPGHLYGHDNVLQLCWVNEGPLGNADVMLWFSYLVPVILMAVAITMMAVFVYRKLNVGQPEANRVRIQTFQTSLRYIVGLLPYWLVVTALFWTMNMMHQGDLDAAHDDSTHYSLHRFLGTFIGLRGVVTLLLWRWADFGRGSRAGRAADDEEGAWDATPALNKALKQEVMQMTSAALLATFHRDRTASIASRASDTSGAPTFGSGGEGTPSPRRAQAGQMPLQGVTRTYDVRRRGHMFKVSFKSLILGGAFGDARGGDASSDGTGDIEHGLLGASREFREGSISGAELPVEAGTDDIDVIPLRDGQKAAGSVFEELEAVAFAHLRSGVGISDDEMRQSFSRTAAGNFSGGASGAFMYFSGDRRFIVKTLTAEEAGVLVDMLPEYAAYVLSHHRTTLLTKFLGLYCMRLYGLEVYFVTMTNIFYARTGDPDRSIHKVVDRYDIKGSRASRNAGTSRRGTPAVCRHCEASFRVGVGSEPCSARPRRGHEEARTLKDNQLTSKLMLGDRGIALVRQLERDSAFLRAHGIMDYSLLVGVCKRRWQHDSGALSRRSFARGPSVSSLLSSPASDRAAAFAATRPASRWSLMDDADDGGAASFEGGVEAAYVEGDAFYYVGVVDILQQWTLEKKAEAMFKRCVLRRHDISAVPPAAYQERLVAFVRDEVLENPELPDATARNGTPLPFTPGLSQGSGSVSGGDSAGAGAGGLGALILPAAVAARHGAADTDEPTASGASEAAAGGVLGEESDAPARQDSGTDYHSL